VLSTFLNGCNPQIEFLLGRRFDPIIVTGGAVHSVGDKVKLVGHHRIATNILFANKEGVKFHKVVDGIVQIPSIIGDVGIMALVSTVNRN
jgi:hypothetical protein